MSTTAARTGRTALTRERIVDAAVALADREGIEAVTIRALATELGAKPMSLYHHVAGKEAILDGVVDRVFAEIEDPAPDLPWRAALRRRCLSARAVLRTHPWAPALLNSRIDPGPAGLAHHESVLACLRRGGFAWGLMAHAYAALDAFVYGFALQEATLPFTDGDEMGELVDQVVQRFPDGAYPTLAAFTTEHVLQPGYAFGDSFEYGLDLLLDGLEAAR